MRAAQAISIILTIALIDATCLLVTALIADVAIAGSAGGVSFGPAPGYYGGMAGRAGLYGPGAGESFQENQYSVTGATANTFNEYQHYRHEGAAAVQYRQGPIAATGPGTVAGLQATGTGQDTCLWDCTAAYTPTECRQFCQ